MKLATLRLLAPVLLVLATGAAPAQEILPTTGVDFPVVGKVKARAASEIAASSWSVGGETIDRDFTVYENYKRFVGPLGAKAIRLQAGWAKCEKQPGVYSWEWLDAIVDDALAQGVQPWLEFNYGNPIYPGGGDTGLGGGFPTSPEALAAWDRWVEALVARYKDRVYQWEVWNEPDINQIGTAPVDAYIDLFIRTASTVRALQSRSQIWALGLAYNIDYADKFLAGVQARGRLDLIDAITIHGYPRNPDDTSNIDRLRAVIAKYPRTIEVRQGETGSNSKYQEHFALRNISWTETLQAKWNLRRMLAHHAKDVPFNLFTMSDMHYTQYHREPDGALRMNHKGLLATNPDQTIAYAKPSYFAAQSVFAIFDATFRRIQDFPWTSTSLRGLSVSAYQREQDGAQVVAYWFSDAPPAQANGVTLADLAVRHGRFKEPVLVDLRTSTVYAIPASRWSQAADGARFKDLPMYDSPLVIAERAALGIVPAGR